MKKLIQVLLFALLAPLAVAQVQNMQATSGATGDLTKPTGGFNLVSGQVINIKTGGTISGAGNYDFSLGTKFVVPNSAAPTTTSFGWLAGDNNAWASSRGALQFFDGTANTYLLGTLASSTPTNGQVPAWQTGGTIIWSSVSTGTIGGSSGSTDKAIIRANGVGGVTIQSSTATLSDDAILTLPQSSLAANTSGDGAILSNATAATAANQRYSPRLRLTGNGWKTTATAGSQVVDFMAEVRPIQGAANPTAQFVIASQINAGGFTDRLTLDSGGNIYFGASASAGFISSSNGNIAVSAAGTNQDITLTPSGTGNFIVSATSGGITVDCSSTNNALVVWKKSGVAKSLMGIAGATNSIVPGSVADDLCIRQSVSGSLWISVDGGTTAALQLVGSTGQLKLLKGITSTSSTTGTVAVTGGLGVSENIFGGGKIISTAPTSGIGYATGAGGAVTQASSRTTGVTLSTVTGAITLVSAAGSATAATFTVTDTAVAATDVVIVNQKSGTDLYEIFVTNVAAGSFKITSFTTGGTTVEQPVFNFAVIKGSLN